VHFDRVSEIQFNSGIPGNMWEFLPIPKYRSFGGIDATRLIVCWSFTSNDDRVPGIVRNWVRGGTGSGNVQHCGIGWLLYPLRPGAWVRVRFTNRSRCRVFQKIRSGYECSCIPRSDPVPRDTTFRKFNFLTFTNVRNRGKLNLMMIQWFIIHRSAWTCFRSTTTTTKYCFI
jgi:hypothetical protein